MGAGLDTTALALSWALYLLSQNEAVDRKLSEEINSVLGDRAASFADLPKSKTEKLVARRRCR